MRRPIALGIAILLIGVGVYITSDSTTPLHSAVDRALATVSDKTRTSSWKLERSVDEMTDEQVLSASRDFQSDLHTVQVKVECTGGNRLKYKFAFYGQNGSAEPLDLSAADAKLQVRLDGDPPFPIRVENPRALNAYEIHLEDAASAKKSFVQITTDRSAYIQSRKGLSGNVLDFGDSGMWMASAERLRISTKLMSDDAVVDFRQSDPVVNEVLGSCGLDHESLREAGDIANAKQAESKAETDNAARIFASMSQTWKPDRPSVDEFKFGDCSLVSGSTTIFTGRCATGSTQMEYPLRREVFFEERPGGLFIDLDIDNGTTASGIYASGGMDPVPIQDMSWNGRCWFNDDIRVCFDRQVRRQ